MSTIRFEPRSAEPDPLLSRVGSLPREVSPLNDLWPGIEVRLDQLPAQRPRRVFGWQQMLAAGFVIGALSTLLVVGLMRSPTQTDSPAEAGPVAQSRFVPVRYGPNSPIGASQLAARDELLAQVQIRLGELRPETRAVIAQNLAIIQSAADEIDVALAADPANELLNELLRGAYWQELQLYSRLVTAGVGPIRRS